ncbi:ATP-binding protein [Labrys okinawensis]|uniref:ATP-binding protein n=1 Tax=Labrys okinawensis TaxID=346911 RepID=UPI0039BC29C0
MSRICRECLYVNAAAARFCGGCGIRIEEASPLPVLEKAPNGGAANVAQLSFGERRLLTVLFADVVGATQLVDRMDPEDLVDLMDGYQSTITAVAARHRGVVSARLGDGMRILFGHPVALEDAAHAAVRAGLDIVRAVENLGEQFGAPEDVALQVRVGIATGTVVASLKNAAEGLEDNLVGSPLNLAARLQHVAPPNGVVIAESTYKLVSTSFALRDIGLHDLKGFQQLARVYEVGGEIRDQSRFERRLRQARTPMINRAHEQEILAQCWARARQGQSEFVSIYGEAGIGKSRLANALTERLADEPHLVLWMQCKSTLVNTALHPHIDLLERICGIEADDGPPARIAKLRTLLSDEDEESEEALALLAPLLSIPPGPDVPRLVMSPHLQQQRTFDLLLRLLTSAAARAPVLLIYEDLHWMDPSSGALAAQIASQARAAPLMVVGTSRPGRPFPWGEGRNVTTLNLGRMSSSESAAIVSSFTAGSSLAPKVVSRIVAHTDGVPLFVEEMTRMIVDAGQDGADSDLPETLRDLLTERLDRLGRAKTVAQIGAVIGREFPVELVAAVARVPAPSLADEITQLLESGLVTGSEDSDVLVFKHALVQDAAYSSLLARDRRELHARVAAQLIAEAENSVPDSPELVARHLKAAGDPLAAAQWWLRAGVQAIQHGGVAEAVAHLEAGLEGLGEAKQGEARQLAELDLLALLGPAQMVRNGPGSPLFGDVQRRAFDTMKILPGQPAQFPVTYGLALFHWARNELDNAERLARELVTTAEMQPTPEFVMAGNNMLAMVLFHTGQPQESRRLLQQSVGLYNPPEHGGLYPRYMMDFGVFGRFYLALASFACGEAEAARGLVKEALPLAEQLQQPHSQGFAMLANFVIACMRRDMEHALFHAERCIAFSGEQGFPEFVAMATIVKGWVIAHRGYIAEGLPMLERGVALWKTTGFEAWQAWFGALRAELLVKAGRGREALEEIATQEARLALNGEWQFASILEATKAQALELEGAAPELIGGTYERALDIARTQQAAGWHFLVSAAHAAWIQRVGQFEQGRQILAGAIALLPSGVAPADLIADWL